MGLREATWNRHCDQRESPDWFASRGSLRSSLTAFAAVLTSPGFGEKAAGSTGRRIPRRRSRLAPVAPFIPARFERFDSLSGWE